MNKPKLVLLMMLALLSVSLLTVTVAAAVPGSGTVYAYSDFGYTTPLPTDSYKGGSWVVHNGETIYLQIANITEFAVGARIRVSICYTDAGGVDHTQFLTGCTVKFLYSGAGAGQVGVGDSSFSIQWVVGEFCSGIIHIPFCSTIVVQYTTEAASGGEVYTASGAMTGGQDRLHVIPEYILGTAGALMSVAAAVGVFKLAKRRKLA